LISADLIGRLILYFYSSRALIALPVFAGKRGHPVLFSSKLYPELLTAPMEKGARAVVWANNNRVHEYVTTEQGCVLNLNDPATFARFTNPLE
jgi:molybdenum cofactor cytidylyltransferase